ncbi:MAG: NIPSNAP family protein [Planctomycetaceae bacterium]
MTRSSSFEKHGMENVAYFVPTDEPKSANTLIYLLAHKSRDAAKASWKAFSEDPEWKKVAAESEANGRLVQKVDAVFLKPTDYSPKPAAK